MDWFRGRRHRRGEGSVDWAPMGRAAPQVLEQSWQGLTVGDPKPAQAGLPQEGLPTMEKVSETEETGYGTPGTGSAWTCPKHRPSESWYQMPTGFGGPPILGQLGAQYPQHASAASTPARSSSTNMPGEAPSLGQEQPMAATAIKQQQPSSGLHPSSQGSSGADVEAVTWHANPAASPSMQRRPSQPLEPPPWSSRPLPAGGSKLPPPPRHLQSLASSRRGIDICNNSTAASARETAEVGRGGGVGCDALGFATTAVGGAVVAPDPVSPFKFVSNLTARREPVPRQPAHAKCSLPWQDQGQGGDTTSISPAPLPGSAARGPSASPAAVVLVPPDCVMPAPSPPPGCAAPAPSPPLARRPEVAPSSPPPPAASSSVHARPAAAAPAPAPPPPPPPLPKPNRVVAIGACSAPPSKSRPRLGIEESAPAALTPPPPPPPAAPTPPAGCGGGMAACSRNIIKAEELQEAASRLRKPAAGGKTATAAAAVAQQKSQDQHTAVAVDQMSPAGHRLPAAASGRAQPQPGAAAGGAREQLMSAIKNREFKLRKVESPGVAGRSRAGGPAATIGRSRPAMAELMRKVAERRAVVEDGESDSDGDWD